jgi:hypothetical protein
MILPLMSSLHTEINSFIRHVYFGLGHQFRKVEKTWDEFFFKGVPSEELFAGLERVNSLSFIWKKG